MVNRLEMVKYNGEFLVKTSKLDPAYISGVQAEVEDEW